MECFIRALFDTKKTNAVRALPRRSGFLHARSSSSKSRVELFVDLSDIMRIALENCQFKPLSNTTDMSTYAARRS